MTARRIREETRRLNLLRPVAVVLLIGLSAMGAGRAVAQDQNQDQSQDPSIGGMQALSLRYKFVERYAAAPEANRPDLLTQYRVGSREKIKMARDKPQGAPELLETTLQTVYTERVVRSRPNGSASDVVRRYDQAQLSTTVPSVRQYQNPRLLEQLTIWYHVDPRKPVEIFNLTEGRLLRQMEFDRIIKNPFIPQLASLLPATPRRVGDVWPVSRGSMATALGAIPLEDDYDVNAELLEVRGIQPGQVNLTAILSVKGNLLLMDGPLSLNARVHFSFPPPANAPAEDAGAGQPKRPSGIVEANGYISELRMAESAVLPLDQEGRLKLTRSRELVLERRLDGPATPSVVVPEAPTNDPAHTWITYDDPEGRFHVAHPQDLRVAQVYPDGAVDLVSRGLDGQDVVQLSLVAKTGDPGKDRIAADPIEQHKALTDQWKQEGQDVLQGPAGWLDEADWKPLNRKVYRIEAALKPSADSGEPQVRGGRVYLDRYIVQFSRDQTLVVTAMTTRDPHVPFRDQAEEMIRSFTLGPSEGTAEGTAEFSPPEASAVEKSK